jgi:hypothetical protein
MKISSRRHRYLTEVHGWLRGEGPATHLPLFWSVERVAQSKKGAARSQRHGARGGPADDHRRRADLRGRRP